MLRIRIAKLKPSAARLTGSIIGEAHASHIRGAVHSAGLNDGDLVVLDFSGIESASASYLKRLLAPFFSMAEVADRPSCNASPVIIGSDAVDLHEDLENYLEGKGWAIIVARDVDGEMRFDRLIGRLDRAATETLQELQSVKEATAQSLYERHPDRTTNQTAWNNRLAQLVELRVARRRREGRVWIYEPTIKN